MLSTGYGRRRPHERGITLIELMVVLVVVAILATVAIVSYRKNVRESKIKGEAYEVLRHFQLKLEQYYAENNEYLETGEDEDDYFPQPLKSDGTRFSAQPASWDALNVDLGRTRLFCGYVVIASSPGGGGAVVGSDAKALGFGAAPAEPWYYVLAVCPGGRRYLVKYDSNEVSAKK